MLETGELFLRLGSALLAGVAVGIGCGLGAYAPVAIALMLVLLVAGGRIDRFIHAHFGRPATAAGDETVPSGRPD